MINANTFGLCTGAQARAQARAQRRCKQRRDRGEAEAEERQRRVACASGSNRQYTQVKEEADEVESGHIIDDSDGCTHDNMHAQG